jgi:hypothetical protein
VIYKIIQSAGLLIIIAVIISCGGGSSTTPNVIPPALPPSVKTIEFHCSKDSNCPEVLIDGDPFAGESFKGYGDPSFEYDSTTDTLWLSYSWLNVLISDSGPPAVFDLGVGIHLAKSEDGGQNFQFVREIKAPEMEAHPDSGDMGWSIHEVSTLVKQADGIWQILWLKYFNPFGIDNERVDFLYWRTTADSPEQLGDVSAVWATSDVTSASWDAPINFNDIPELSDCTIQTEPALFNQNNNTYLVSSCLVVDAQGRRADLERLVLLQQDVNGYRFIEDIMDTQDANNLGVDVIQQAVISVARDGSIIMLVTGIIMDVDPSHQGCIVYEFDDFSNGQLKRDVNGNTIPRAIITSDGNGLGPGLCSYDAQNDSGILLVMTTISQNGTDIEFSLRATGIRL